MDTIILLQFNAMLKNWKIGTHKKLLNGSEISVFKLMLK